MNEETKLRVQALDKAINGFLLVLEQKRMWWGWGNETASGMIVPYGVWHYAKKYPTHRGTIEIWPEKGHSIRTGRKGSPDIVGIFKKDKDTPGVFVGIEMKTGTARQTAEQVYAQTIIEQLGGIYIVARSVRDVEDRLYPSPVRALIEKNDDYDYSKIPF